MAQGRSIRIYLADGSAAGIRHAEVVNWPGQAIVCPRARVGELKSWDQSQRPGVYILVGEDPESPRPLVYVGQSESVFDRLKQHLADESKEFWDQVVFFTSKDDNLTTSHVKYLESRFVTIAGDVNRVTLKNANTPTLSALPRADRDAMEEFLEPTRLLLPALGFQLLQPIAKKVRQEDSTGFSGPLAAVQLVFNRPSKGFAAKGVSTDEGFVVLANSVGGRPIPSMRPGRKMLRERLIADGSVTEFDELGEGEIEPEDKESKKIRFNRDVLFTSPSAAASIVSGGPANGRKDWTNAKGKTLKYLENKLVEFEPSFKKALDEIEQTQPSS